MNGHLIIPSSFIKYLELYLDETLSGNHHCDLLVKKLKRANGMLSKARHNVPNNELKSIYYAIFSSHMVFGFHVWGQNINIHTGEVSKLQYRALRIINFSDFRAEPNPLYKDSSILKLEHQIALQNCLFVHDYFKNKLPNCFADYFHTTQEIYQINTKSSELGSLFIPYFSTSKYGLNSVTRKCIDIWNFFTKTFNSNLLQLSRHVLKTRIQTHFMESY